MLGKGGSSKFTGNAGKCDRSAVTQWIDAAPVPHVRSAKIGYHGIAQAGSFKGMYLNSIDLVYIGQ
jgi:hypothetical protein